MTRVGRLVAAGMTAAFVVSPLQAAVVVDPVPNPIAYGLTAAVVPFITAPSTSASVPQALVHGLKAAPDASGRLFVNDTRGTINVTTTSGSTPAVWFDIRQQNVGFSEPNNQAGLLSFAFHPNFGRDPSKPGYATFYTVDTTAASGAAKYNGNGTRIDHDDVVREWTVADPAAATAQVTATREVLRVGQPNSDHGPGTIAFNPTAAAGTADYGKLYIGLGDGGGINDPHDNAQDLNSPFGKILRIDPADPDGAGPQSYSIPGDNPFAGQQGKLSEVYASGLRNPQQFGWDAVTGTLYIADIGQANLEEVNAGVAGGNYGWPLREGTFGGTPDKSQQVVTDAPSPGGFIDPIAEYDHGEGSAVSAAILYRGGAVADLFGKAVVSDLVNGRLFYFTPGDTSGVGGTAILSEIALMMDGNPTSMLTLEGQSRGRVDLRLGTDAAGELYLLTTQNGDIYRLFAASVPEPATWATMVAGFALLGATLRRRKVRAAMA